MSILELLQPVGTLLSMVRLKTDRLRLRKLMEQGLTVGKNVYIMEDVEFDLGYPFLIEIGDNCRIAKGVRILTHDATTFRELGVTRIAPVRILEGTFIGERVIILPGVTIGPRALIAAGSVVNRDLGPEVAAAGNPARPYGKYSELLSKYEAIAGSGTVFKQDEIDAGVVTKDSMIKGVEKNGVAFIRGVPRKDPYYVNTNFSEMRVNALRAYERMKKGQCAAKPTISNSSGKS